VENDAHIGVILKHAGRRARPHPSVATRG
jgi:hypothetical protein